MRSLSRSFLLSTAILASSTSGLLAKSEPLVTIDFKSYERLLTDVGAFAGATGQDPELITMQASMTLGAGLVKLMDTTQPWHAAVWMESLGDKPVIALVLPVEDYEGFQTAIAASMLGQMGAQHFDAGDSVVLFGSSPGAIVPDGWDAVIEAYVTNLKVSPTHTVEVKLEMSDEFRSAAVASLALPKAQMMAAFDEPGADTAGMPPETMKGMMESYFAFYESILMDTERFEFNLGVNDAVLDFEIGMAPVEGSGLAEFIGSQDVEIMDLASSVDWNSGMAMLVGMNDLPESWDPLLDSAMQSLMPLYGLDESAAAEWTAVMQSTLPFKGAYTMNFEDGMSFYGFYEILEGSAEEVYEEWIRVTTSIVTEGEGVEPYYSDIKVEKDVRKVSGNSVDRIELTMNPEHPTMQLPEQQEMMNQMFSGGKLVYEMVQVDNRIYMAMDGGLEAAMKMNSGAESPVALSSDTRFVATMNFAELLKLGATMSGEDLPKALADADPEDVRLTYVLESSDDLVLRTTFPLSIISMFSEME